MAALLYFALSLTSLFLIPWAKAQWGETNLPPLLPEVRLVINLVYVNLAVSFFVLIRRFKKGLLPHAGWWAAFAVIGTALCAVHPVFSGDLMEYLVRGRILGIYHLSPYQHVPAEFPQDLLFAHSTWKVNPDSYGPLYVFLETIPALVFPDSVKGMVWLEKVILLGFLAPGAFYFAKLVSRFDRAPRAAGTVLLFALNPLLWVSTVIDGHNDTVMLALTIASVYFLLEGKYTRCFLLWTAGFLVKYTVLLVLPFLVVTAVRREWRRQGGFPWTFVAKEAAWNTALIVLAFFPLWGGADTFLALIRASAWFYTNTIPYAAHQALSLAGAAPDPAWLKYGFLAVFFALYVYWLWRHGAETELDPPRFFRRLCLMYLAFYATITIPFGFHYLLWALPWLILSHWPMERFLITLYSFAGLFSYFKRMNYLLILATAIYFTALVVRRFLPIHRAERVTT